MIPARVLPCLALAALLLPCSGCMKQGPPAPAGASLKSVPEAYSRSVAALMWPGATRAFQVTPRGDLYNGAWLTRVTPTADGREALAPAVIAYEDRWCPVVRWTRTSGAIRWDFEAVAFPSRCRDCSRGAARRGVARRGGLGARPRPAPGRRRGRHLPGSRPRLDPAPRQASTRARPRGSRGTCSSRCSCARPTPPPHPSPPGSRSPSSGPTAPLTYGSPDSLVRTPWEHGWERRAKPTRRSGGAPIPSRGGSIAGASACAPRGEDQVRVLLPAYPTPERELRVEARVSHDQRAATGARTGAARSSAGPASSCRIPTCAMRSAPAG